MKCDKDAGIERKGLRDLTVKVSLAFIEEEKM